MRTRTIGTFHVYFLLLLIHFCPAHYDLLM
jgi:hypothetical protein